MPLNRRESVAVWLLLTIGLCRCAMTHQAEKEAVHEEQAAVIATKHEGPVRITTETEEYRDDGQPQEAAPETPAGGLPDVQAVEGRAGQERQGAGAEAQAGTARPPQRGRLVRRTVRVEEHGPTDSELSAIYRAQDKEHEKIVETKTPQLPKVPISCGCTGGLLGIGFAVVILAVIVRKGRALLAFLKPPLP